MEISTGNRVLISGASGGLGAAVVQAFVTRGAHVAGVARTAGAGDAVEWITGDLARPEEARRVVEAAGRVDVLVHLMGGFDGGSPVHQTGDDVWTRMLDLNLNSAFYLLRAVLPGMLAAGRGRIIAVSSRTALEPAAGLSAYGVSKAALNALIRTVALETRNSGVTANAVLPSVIDTPANRRAMPSADFTRWVTPESIAGTICWLASDAAADVSGALIPVYGRA